MSNDGELILVNDGAGAASVNVRFTAEAFPAPRDLTVAVDGRRVGRWQVQPNAERYIVARAITLTAGRHRIVFHTPQAPVSPSSRGYGKDMRPLSVAFGPFSVVDTGAPEARTDWTAPFAVGPVSSKQYTVQENAAHHLRRQGRLAEAALGYERALRGAVSDPTYLFYGMTLLAIDRRSEARRVFQECADRTRAGILAARMRDVCRRAAVYVEESVILAQTGGDPGRLARAEGRIADAIETYHNAIVADAGALQAHYWLAVIYGLAERHDETRGHLDRAVELAGDSVDGRFLRLLRPYL